MLCHLSSRTIQCVSLAVFATSLILAAAAEECVQSATTTDGSTSLYLLQAHAALRPRSDFTAEGATKQAETETNENAELLAGLQNSSTVDAYFANRAALEEKQDRHQQLLSRTAPSVSPWAQHHKPSWVNMFIENASSCFTGVTPPAGSEGLGDGLGEKRGRLVADLTPVTGATLRVINAGMGTTATRGLHEAMCEQGVPSVHWGRACHVHPEAREKVKKVLEIYKGFMKCANLEYSRKDARCSMDNFRGLLLPALKAVITSGVVSVSDAPYSDLLPTMLALVPGLKVVQTLRDRDEWVTRRLKFHGLDVICKDRKAHGAASYFDALGCAGSGVHWVSDALLSQRKSFAQSRQKLGKDEAYAALASRFAAHNAVFAQHADTIPGIGGFRQLCAWDAGFADGVRETARAVAAAGNGRGRSLLQAGVSDEAVVEDEGNERYVNQERDDERYVNQEREDERYVNQEREDERYVNQQAVVEEMRKAAASEELLGQDDLQGDPTMSLFQRFEATFARRLNTEGTYPHAGEFFQWLQQEHEAAPYRMSLS